MEPEDVSGLRFQGLGFRVSGFGVSGFQGLGFRVSGFRVSGFKVFPFAQFRHLTLAIHFPQSRNQGCSRVFNLGSLFLGLLKGSTTRVFMHSIQHRSQGAQASQSPTRTKISLSC